VTRCVSGLGTGVGAVLLTGCEVGGTRRRLCRSPAMLREKQLSNPWKKHANIRALYQRRP
jgi:hypothetical protein